MLVSDCSVVSMCTELELFDLSGCDISQQTVDAALTSVKMRTNNVPLRLIVGGNVTICSVLVVEFLNGVFVNCIECVKK